MIGYKLNISHNDRIISSHTIALSDITEFKKINGSWSVKQDVNFIGWLYLNKFGLDIMSYRMDEYKKDDYSFTILVRSEDLQKMRDNKINQLGI